VIESELAPVLEAAEPSVEPGPEVEDAGVLEEPPCEVGDDEGPAEPEVMLKFEPGAVEFEKLEEVVQFADVKLEF
jgi:hypothetical protein